MSKYEKTSKILKVLSHPVRLQIVAGLLKNECNVSEIQEKLGLPQSTISQHLRILKDAGIIKGRRTGTVVCYRVINELGRKMMRLIK